MTCYPFGKNYEVVMSAGELYGRFNLAISKDWRGWVWSLTMQFNPSSQMFEYVASLRRSTRHRECSMLFCISGFALWQRPDVAGIADDWALQFTGEARDIMGINTYKTDGKNVVVDT